MPKRLLILVAHPDDESFGSGGTIARYVAEGVAVHVVIATDGAAGSVVEEYANERERLVEIRDKELETAVSILGATLHKLNYRDSGYIGDPANNHPDAFIQSDLEEGTRRVVALIRQIRPQVVVTHDPTGGYFHPDHIQCNKITTPAFYAAGDASQYPDIGPAPYQPQKLYFGAFPNRWIKFFTFLMRLRGQDPKRMGRNKDIDMTRLGYPRKKVHTLVNFSRYWDVKKEASAAHASQGGGGGGTRGGLLPEWIQRRWLANEMYIRAHPPTPDGYSEKDLFAGVDLSDKVVDQARLGD